MTNKEKMDNVIAGLGELIAYKDSTISSKEWWINEYKKQIEALKEENEKLRKAYDEIVNELATVNEMLKETEKENAMLENALKDAEALLDKYKGGAVYVD